MICNEIFCRLEKAFWLAFHMGGVFCASVRRFEGFCNLVWDRSLDHFCRSLNAWFEVGDFQRCAHFLSHELADIGKPRPYRVR
jgi:hypothetical protein